MSDVVGSPFFWISLVVLENELLLILFLSIGYLASPKSTIHLLPPEVYDEYERDKIRHAAASAAPAPQVAEETHKHHFLHRHENPPAPAPTPPVSQNVTSEEHHHHHFLFHKHENPTPQGEEIKFHSGEKLTYPQKFRLMNHVFRRLHDEVLHYASSLEQVNTVSDDNGIKLTLRRKKLVVFDIRQTSAAPIASAGKTAEKRESEYFPLLKINLYDPSFADIVGETHGGSLIKKKPVEVRLKDEGSAKLAKETIKLVYDRFNKVEI